MSAATPASRSIQHDQRHRTLLRVLHARLFVNVEGRVFVSRGRPVAEKLRRGLAQQRMPPTAAEAPTPQQLGLELSDGELPPAMWHEMSRALKRWTNELQRELRQRPARRRAGRLLASERDELNRLSSRLEACAQWRDALRAGREPAGTPYLLCADEELSLQQILAEAPGSSPLIIGWLARVVFWLAGSRAARRFVWAVAPHLPALLDLHGGDSRLRQFIDRLPIWCQRSVCEPSRALQAELKLALAALPPHLVQAGRLSARLRGRGFAQHCGQLLARCRELLCHEREAIGSRLPGLLAAWAASDGGTAPLPQRLIAPTQTKDGLQQFEQGLAILEKEAHQKGYDALLLALDRVEPPANPREYGAIRQLLVRGASHDDIAWSASQGLLRWLSSRGVQPQRLRCEIESLNRCKLELQAEDHFAVAETLAIPQGRKLLSQWRQWLHRYESAVRTTKMRQRFKQAFLRSLDWIGRQAEYANCLSEWFQPRANCLEDGLLPKGVNRRQMERLAAYQRMAGKAVSLPKSIRDLLDERAALQRECAYLRDRAAAGDATTGMRFRWQRLEARLAADGDGGPERLARAEDEALLVAAAEALPAIVRQAAEKKWQDLTCVPVLELPVEWLLNLVDWVHALHEPQQALLQSILDAWQRHGADYKRHLPGNLAWLSAAAARGWDLANWLSPPERAAQLGQRDVAIGASCDPREVFHMGDYFRTCLSLSGGQQTSVLANAHDANKHVIYLREPGASRHILGRQLIAISSDGMLIGYHCYLGIENKHSELRAQALALMAEYCGQVARRCKLPLADQGKPQTLCSVDWWDDGVWAWHAAARQAGPASHVPSIESCFPFVADTTESLVSLADELAVGLVG